jgi:hypothetical protein
VKLTQSESDISGLVALAGMLDMEPFPDGYIKISGSRSWVPILLRCVGRLKQLEALPPDPTPDPEKPAP